MNLYIHLYLVLLPFVIHSVWAQQLMPSSSRSLSTPTATASSLSLSLSFSLLSSALPMTMSSLSMPLTSSVSDSGATAVLTTKTLTSPSIIPIAFPSSSPSTSGFQPDSRPATQPEEESWLKTNNRFVFVLILGLLFLALLLWYIVKSIKGMRKRLRRENETQMKMIQRVTASTNLENEKDLGYSEEITTTTMEPKYQTHSLPPSTSDTKT